MRVGGASVNLSLVDTDSGFGAASPPCVGSANLAHYRRIIEVGYPLTLVNWREA